VPIVDRVLGSRPFSLADQRAFAALSGDFNPVHVDPVEARRTMFGGPIVHGIHSMLYALDRLVAAETAPQRSIAQLRASFRQAVSLDRPVVVRAASGDDPQRFELRIELDQQIVSTISGRWGTGEVASLEVVDAPISPRAPVNAPFETLAAASGSLPLHLERAAARELFPALSAQLHPAQLAELLATTRIVGMECPGLYSLYSGLELKASPTSATTLGWRVGKSDARVGVLSVAITGPTLSGSLATFVRPRPHAQAELKAIAELVRPEEFRGHHALVVGGSRGLGEVTAKCIAAGGGKTTITYASGAEDAERLASEIRAHGGRSACAKLDVLSTELDLSFLASEPPTHLYYFATPHISIDRNRSFSTEHFEQLSRYYVGGFVRLVEAVRALYDRELVVIFPSTVFLDEPPPGAMEYSLAKAAGEAACRLLEKTHPRLRAHSPRLPRMKTDQTVGLLPGNAAEPVAVMLELLRSMAASS